MYCNTRRFLAACAIALPALAFWLGGSAAHAASFTYNVSLPTDDLNTVAANPYSLDFMLISGGTGDVVNTVTLSNFNVGPTSPITLTSNQFFSEDIEPFTQAASPGGVVSFQLTTTNNAETDPGTSPDEFSFYIDDNTTFPISTSDALASSLFTIDLGGSAPTVTTYPGTGSYSDVAPTVTAAPTPETSSVAALGLMLMAGGVCAIARRKAAISAAH